MQDIQVELQVFLDQQLSCLGKELEGSFSLGINHLANPAMFPIHCLKLVVLSCHHLNQDLIRFSQSPHLFFVLLFLLTL